MGKLPLDVRSQDSIPAFEDLISKGPMTVILVYADWCGHCDKFKENIWKPLNSTVNRTMNMASVHYDQLENTSLKNSTINGYPSLLVVGTDKEPASFESESGMTNAMPNANDLGTMKRIVTTPINTMKPKNTSTSTSTLSANAYRTANTNNMRNVNANTNTMRNVNANTNTNTNNMRTANDMRTINVNNSNALNNLSTINNEGETLNMNNVNVSKSTIGTNAKEIITPPNMNEDILDAYEGNSVSLNSVNSAVNSAVNTPSALNTMNNTSVSSPQNSGVEVNTLKNIPRNTQGTTPILNGGRLYRKLSSKRKSKSQSKSKSKSVSKTSKSSKKSRKN